MHTTGLLSALNLSTLIIVVSVVAVGLAIFLRKRSNRKPMEGKAERNVARDLDAGRAAPSALPPERDR